MSRSSGRGQTEPLAALVAVVAVGVALSLYVGVLDAQLPGSGDRHVADAAIERVESALAPTAVVLPERMADAQAAGPTGFETNVTLTTGDRRWHAGPVAPGGADEASARIGVRVAPSRVRTGNLTVRVWP